MINPAPFLIKDRNAQNGFRYNITFPIDSMAGFGFNVDFTGKIATVTAMNVSSYTLKKNGVTTALPFQVTKGDTITLEDVVKIDNARASTFYFYAPKFDSQTVSINALTQVDATRKHLFVINYTDQTISVIDTDTDTVASTITLPAGYEFQSIIYRLVDDHMYVFGLNRVCKIDANPASGTFLNVYSIAGVLNGSTNLFTGATNRFTDAIYDYVNDLCYVTETIRSEFYVWDFVSGSTSSTFSNVNNSSGVYVPSGKVLQNSAFSTLTENGDAKAWRLELTSNFTIKGSYISKSNTFACGRQSLQELDISDLSLVRLYTGSSTGGQSAWNQIYGNAIYSPYYDLLIGLTYEQGGGVISVIDMDTNTYLGQFTRTNKQTNDTIARSMVYGAYAKKFYFIANGTSPQNRLHKLNPQLWISNGKTNLADMIDGYITVGDLTNLTGNTSSDSRRYANCAIAFNHLIPC